jgi:hypothetical protein
MLAKTSTCMSVVLCMTLGAARAASAQETETEAVATTASTAGTDQLTLPPSRLLLDAFVGINLSSDAVFKPFSISPDIWYGATEAITVGLVHSGVGASGFLGAPGTALCLTGASNGCADVYPGFGVDVRYKLKTGAFAWAADGGLYVNAFDPFQLAIKLGAIGRWTSDKIAVELAPNLFFGLTNRSPEPVMMVAVEGNQEILNLPVTGLYALTPKASVALQTGVILPFQNTGDSYAIPLSIGGHFLAMPDLNVSLAFSLPKLVGGGDDAGVDARVLTLGGTYAF